MPRKFKAAPTIYNYLPHIQVNSEGYVFRFQGEEYTGPHYATHAKTISFGKNHALRVLYHYLKDMCVLPIIKYNTTSGDWWYTYNTKEYRGKANPPAHSWTKGLHNLMRCYEFTPDQLKQIKEMFK